MIPITYNFARCESFNEDYIVAHMNEVALAPKNIPLEQAARIPMVSLTAWSALFDCAHLRKGQSILIQGASGGVGHMAVQLAKNAGAYVIGVTSQPNLNLVKSLGADQVIDYRSEDFSQKVKNMDVVFDAVGSETHTKSFAVIKKRGILVSIVDPPDELIAKQFGVSGKFAFVSTNGKRLEEISKLIDAGKLRVVIDKTFPLSEAKAAQEYSQAGHVRGKIILNVSN